MSRSPAGTVAHALLRPASGWAGAFALAWAVALAAAPTPAAANPELARSKRCLNCHAVDRKLVGPAFRDVAKRYAGQPDAPARLADKIVKGGAGAWGPVPMAANPQLSPADAKLLATWVLSVK